MVSERTGGEVGWGEMILGKNERIHILIACFAWFFLHAPCNLLMKI